MLYLSSGTCVSLCFIADIAAYLKIIIVKINFNIRVNNNQTLKNILIIHFYEKKPFYVCLELFY